MTSPRPRVDASAWTTPPISRPLTSAHRHLWVLLDGTPAHAIPGALTYNDDGRVACHLCGRWFNHLGIHLRQHGWTSVDYRRAVGLPVRQPLCSKRLSTKIAKRQRVTWDTHAELRRSFTEGHEAARSGELARRSAEVRRLRIARGEVPEAVRRDQHHRLERGRVTTARRRSDERHALVTSAGHLSLGEFLSAEYAAGASLDALAKLLHLGRANLVNELETAGVEVRRPGVRLHANQGRADRIDVSVAERLGVGDISAWLRDRHASGESQHSLARVTGRSIPWVRSRIAGTTTTKVLSRPPTLPIG